MQIPAALLFAFVAAAPLAAQRGRTDPSTIELTNFSWKEAKFHSDAIDADVNYLVYLPKAYDDKEQADTKWPLIVWLHGMFEDDMRFHVRGGAPMIDAAVKDGTLSPCVFVCPNGGRTSMYVNRKDKKYEDLVTKDLLAHLAATYRISDRRDQRAIMGVSMGGFGAMKIAFKHPDLFGIVAVHSAAILTEDPEKLQEQFPWLRQRGASLLAAIFGEPVDVEKYHAENVLTLAKTVDVEKLAGLKIWFEAGTADRYKFHLTNGLLHDALEERKIRHTWRLVDGGGHSWGEGATQEGLPQSLGFVAAQFSVGRASAGLGALFGGEAGVDKGKDEGAKEAPTKGDGEEKKR